MLKLSQFEKVSEVHSFNHTIPTGSGEVEIRVRKVKENYENKFSYYLDIIVEDGRMVVENKPFHEKLHLDDYLSEWEEENISQSIN